MGQISRHLPVMHLVAVTSAFPEAFIWGKNRMKERWGDIFRCSQAFDFTETSYYEKSMGSELVKQFWVFEDLIDPRELPASKIYSNALEKEFADSQAWSVDRPINLDPGYLTEAKLVLATTKDRDHRIYLEQGIYAEVTLHFHHGEWKSRAWTYPDYQRQDFQEFFTECRTELRSRYRSLKAQTSRERSSD